ncbi:MAG: hypothetical protein IKV82_06155 [Akkermansia sp.]|nr:hypothetical protein [Akkermansia sp.]
MLATISPLIARGVIDNTRPSITTLHLWCVDGGEPVEYELVGNCRRDIAGCRVEFTNHAAADAVNSEPDILRDMRRPGLTMTMGDITLSRRCRDQDNRKSLNNQLYIEFFSGGSARFLIESSHFSFTTSLPQWDATWEDDNAQHFFNLEAFRHHIITNVSQFRGPAITGLGEDFPACAWDTCLNEAEAYIAICPTVFEKYACTPHGNLSAAYVLDRLEYLQQIAAEEEADLPPDMESTQFGHEVFDFIPAEHRDMVQRAMQHPLFTETSRLTALIQEKLIPTLKPTDTNTKADQFLKNYATLVSNILATILLTMQQQYPMELVNTRSLSLCNRLSALADYCRVLPINCRQPLADACRDLAVHLQDYTTSLHS